MSVQLPEGAKALLDAKTFVTVATVEPNGQPQLSVVWVKTDGDDILMSTLEGRRKHTNLLANPRITVSAFVPDNPYKYVEVRGTATMTTEGGRELIDEFQEKYHGNRPYPNDGPDAVRVVIRVAADKVIVRGL